MGYLPSTPLPGQLTSPYNPILSPMAKASKKRVSIAAKMSGFIYIFAII
jgi:hypothetical protein